MIKYGRNVLSATLLIKDDKIFHSFLNFLPNMTWWQLFSKLYYQIFYYTPYITPKRVTSLLGPSSCHCTQETQLLSKKYSRGSEPLATLRPIWSARNFNFKSPALETNALPLDQLAAKIVSILGMQTLVDLQARIWSRIYWNSSSMKKKIKLKNFMNNFRMFFPYMTSWQLYNNNNCLKFQMYYRHDLLAVTDDTIF